MKHHGVTWCALAAAFSLSCGGDDGSVIEPSLAGQVQFSVDTVRVGEQTSATVRLLFQGAQAIGPVRLISLPMVTATGGAVPGLEVTVSPEQIPALSPGASIPLTFQMATSSSVSPGDYFGAIEAVLGIQVLGSLPVRATVSAPANDVAVGELSITGPDSARQGDVIELAAAARSDAGDLLNVPVTWSFTPGTAGVMTTEGLFVGYQAGPVTFRAAAGGVTDSAVVVLTARTGGGSFSVAGRGVMVDRYTSDIWVHGSFAYTGTWGVRVTSSSANQGNRLYVWSIADPSQPVLVDSVMIDARTLNDIKVRSDGAIGVITHEASSDAQNGITILGLADPAHPTVLSRFTNGLESGVHNTWIEGDYVYVALDGIGNGLRILDISDPGSPKVVAQFYGGSSFLHDVYVRDGFAFLSHWDAGLIILDVGNGGFGGSPANPVEVSRIRTAGGQTHNAWYWPAGRYVFVGEEDFQTPGIMHVVDVSNIESPREVATYSVPGVTPHNFWLDEPNEVLYLAWYESGIRALDVSGRLLGALEREGRELEGFRYTVAGTCAGVSGTCAWAPQLHQGRVYVADMNTGLWVLNASF